MLINADSVNLQKPVVRGAEVSQGVKATIRHEQHMVLRADKDGTAQLGVPLSSLQV